MAIGGIHPNTEVGESRITLLLDVPINGGITLAALVPRPRVNVTRFHRVFSPYSKLREYVVP